MIDTIIFDIGGVLVRGGHKGVIWSWLAEKSQVYEAVIQEIVSGKYRAQEKRAWDAWKIGACSESEYWQQTLQGTGLENRADEIAQCVREGFERCERESAWRFMPQLKEQGYCLAVLSNHTKEWGWRVVDRLELRKYCDPIIISADVGLKKPDAAIYAYTLKAVGRESTPERCFFIDDKIENVVAARAAGMHAFEFKDCGAERADTLLELELHKYGLL